MIQKFVPWFFSDRSQFLRSLSVESSHRSLQDLHIVLTTSLYSLSVPYLIVVPFLCSYKFSWFSCQFSPKFPRLDPSFGFLKVFVGLSQDFRSVVSNPSAWINICLRLMLDPEIKLKKNSVKIWIELRGHRFLEVWNEYIEQSEVMNLDWAWK